MKFLLIAWVSLSPGKFSWQEVKVVDSPAECIQIAKEYKIAVYRCMKEKQ